MIDKTSIFNSASKFAAKGQIDKAIAEWKKLLEHKKDGNVYNSIGDLYLKKGSEDEAIAAFTNAAESFKKEGFYPKAIAIYKKILNLVPSNVNAMIALAMLNAEKGLVGNAIELYFKAAEIFQRENATEKTVKVIEKILQLSPSDTDSRAKIAELYVRSGHRERAANEYTEIASVYLLKDEIETADEFYQKALSLDNENIQAITGLGNTADKKGETEKAFTYLEKALSLEPGNKETLTAYTNMAIKAGKTDNAHAMLTKAAEADPADLHVKELLGTLYIYKKMFNDAWDVMLPCIEDAVNEKKWPEALELLNNFRESHQVQSTELIIDIYRAKGDTDLLAGELKILAALYTAQAMEESALDLYKEVLAVAPEDTEASARIREIEISLGIAQPAPESPEEEQGTILEMEEAAAGAPQHAKPGPEGNLMEDMLMAMHDDVPQAEAAQTSELKIDESLLMDNLAPSQTTAEEPAAAAAGAALSPEEFAEKKAEADFFIQQGMEKEAAEIYRDLLSSAPDNEEIKKKLSSIHVLPEAEKPADAEKPVQQPAEASSTNSELQDLFSQFENSGETIETAIPETAQDIPESAPGSELSDMLNKLGASESPADVDHEAAYAAGLEYKQKGRFDEAIKEFQTAAGSPERQLLSSSMIASCYMEKKEYPYAIKEYAKILESLSPDDGSYLRIKYELAGAYMNNKDNNMALELYSEIHADDPEFKDTSDKIESLRSAPDEKKPKKSRVSYI